MRLIILLVALISLVSSLDLKMEEGDSSLKAKWGSWRKKWPTGKNKPWPRKKLPWPKRYTRKTWKGYKRMKPWYKGATVKTIFAGVITTAAAHFLVNKYFDGSVGRYNNCVRDDQCAQSIDDATISQSEYDRIQRINNSL